jgi:hypothetical protein
LFIQSIHIICFFNSRIKVHIVTSILVLQFQNVLCHDTKFSSVHQVYRIMTNIYKIKLFWLNPPGICIHG